MKTQKISKSLNATDNEFSKIATRKWYAIDNQNNTEYGEGNESDSSITFETKVSKSNLCDSSDAYILVTGDITAAGGNANTKVAFKNCAPFTRCVTHINDEHIDTAENLDMLLYNLIEYSDNYAGTCGSLWKFKIDEQNMNNGNRGNVTTNDSTSFEYKSSFLGESIAVGANRVFENIKIAVPMKYLSNFWRYIRNAID